MRITLVAVTSINGKITRGDDPDIYKWTSKEDQEYYFLQIKRSKLIVMGSSTYGAAKHLIKLEKGTLRIVLTRTPGKYENEQEKGVLEFSNEKPSELVRRLEKQFDELTLVGGSRISSSFMKAGLVDEIYLTIEPVVFGSGKPLFADEEFESTFELVSIEKLNKKGTVMLKYKRILSSLACLPAFGGTRDPE